MNGPPPGTRQRAKARALLAATAQCAASGALPVVRDALDRAASADARPFELIAGAPLSRYGARLTFVARRTAMKLAEAFGVAGHPWGIPAWVGVRVRSDGSRAIKAYHRVTVHEGFPPLPDSFPRDLYPVMASLAGDDVELYLRCRTSCAWGTFAASCLAPLAAPAGAFAPRPRPAEHAFCVSVRWTRGLLTAVTLYADHRGLPDERTTEREWAAGLDAEAERSYRAALATVHELRGRRGPVVHAMLAWSVDGNGVWQRAASIALPDAF